MEKIVNIYDVIKSDKAISPEDGDLVFNRISFEINAGNVVILDFNSLTTIISAFLNRAVGQLYSRFNSEHLRTFLKTKNMDDDTKHILRLVVERAKQFYSSPESYKNAAKEVFDHDD
ncbi:MAG: STAS-like domain-containing protein [Crenarchaeota archaeon]|nr:STAS-like domain-containing protein [Thermoproteota archaeon]NLN47671.1 STAS-like domain-containing protein [Clostridiales bacterium]